MGRKTHPTCQAKEGDLTDQVELAQVVFQGFALLRIQRFTSNRPPIF